jgi:glycosyltransferase involved in cell wall biosynthesis
VIVTLQRPTLTRCVNAVLNVIPNANIILITERGNIGDLRNEGLRQVESEIFAFVDDDVIVNKRWFKECMKYIDRYDMVCGRYYPFTGLGACVCRTSAFKKTKFDRRYDGTIYSKVRYIVVDVWCDHLDYHYIRHVLFWLRHSGVGHGVRGCLHHMFIGLFKRKDCYIFANFSILLVFAVVNKAIKLPARILISLLR